MSNTTTKTNLEVYLEGLKVAKRILKEQEADLNSKP